MIYEVKTIIKGVEVFEQRENYEADGVEYYQPFIFNVIYENNATLGAMDIGATASDVLTFTMANPFASSFDGERVELWVSPTDGIESIKSEIEESVGDSTEVASIDEVENDTDVNETEEEGDPITDEELADVTATNEAETIDTFNQLEGEADTTTPIEPDPSEWIRLGVFYVRQQTTNEDGSVTLKCYDGFSLMNSEYIPTTANDTVQNIFNDLKAQALETCGITIADFEYDTEYNANIDWTITTSYRDAIGYLAGIVGGYAAFDSDGVCNISFYGYNGETLIRSELISIIEDSAGEMLLTELRCDNSTNAQPNIIEAGAGQGIEFKNPFVTQDILDAILESYKGIRYTGGTITANWVESINAGEFVRVFSEDEYANYLAISNEINNSTHTDAELLELKENLNSLGSMFLVASQVVSLDGDARTSITSSNGSEFSKENKQFPPMLKEIIEAGKTATNYIWQDEDGALRISRDADNYSVRIDADSLDVMDGDKVIASFGEVVDLIGDNATTRIGSDGMTIYDVDGSAFFDVHKTRAGETATEVVKVKRTTGSTFKGKPSKAFTRIDSVTYYGEDVPYTFSNGELTCTIYTMASVSITDVKITGVANAETNMTLGGQLTVEGHTSAIGSRVTGGNTTIITSGATYRELGTFALPAGVWHVDASVYASIGAGQRLGIILALEHNGTTTNHLASRSIGQTSVATTIAVHGGKSFTIEDGDIIHVRGFVTVASGSSAQPSVEWAYDAVRIV